MHSRFFHWTLLAAVTLYCRWVGANDAFDIKVYCAPKVGGIVVDGKLSEKAWSKAPLVGDFTYYGKGIKADPQTFFRVVYDDARLIFGVFCEDPEAAKIPRVPQIRDAHAIFADEAVEIFVDPGHTFKTYYQFAVNVAGSIYDSKGTDPAWNGSVVAATSLGRDGWTLEFAIPWKDLGMSPKAGAILGFNVCRDRHIGAKQWTNWARVIGGFHDPPRFADLILDGNAGEIAALGGELRKGGRTGRIVVFTRSGFGRATYRALAAAALARIEKKLKALAHDAARDPNPAVRRETTKLIARYRARLAEIRRRLTRAKTVDARVWSEVDRAVAALEAGLNEAVWQARLTAVLSAI